MELKLSIDLRVSAPALVEAIRDGIAALVQLREDVKAMGTSLSQQIDAATASLQGDIATLTTGVSNLETQLSAALGGITPGSTVTQAQVDALTTIHTNLAALAASIPSTAATT